ncbi:hypothetical protein [Oribacterium asaccharolyticum]|nr:hypothetical protein [Oribacterium asaccharolyticum]
MAAPVVEEDLVEQEEQMVLMALVAVHIHTDIEGSRLSELPERVPM